MARVFTVDEAAEYLHVSPYTIRKWLRTGKIPGRKIGRAYHIVEAELEAMLRSPSLPSADSDLHISEDELTWRKRDEEFKEKARARRLEWQSLTPEQKRARVDAVRGKYADVHFSSDDLIRERRLENERDERRWKERFGH